MRRKFRKPTKVEHDAMWASGKILAIALFNKPSILKTLKKLKEFKVEGFE